MSKKKPKGKTKNQNFPEHIYAKIPIGDLILVGILNVLRSGEICTFERLVAECFIKFPKVFGFKRYPHWPDSLKLDRPLRNLREKGFITGTVRDHFELTQFGYTKALDVESILKEKKKATYRKKIVSKGRSADDRLIEHIKNSSAFMKFSSAPENFSVSLPEFLELLRCTLETPLRVIKQNLEYLKNLAKLYKEDEIYKFLILCEEKFLKGGANG